jgi:hypothetical protein
VDNIAIDTNNIETAEADNDGIHNVAVAVVVADSIAADTDADSTVVGDADNIEVAVEDNIVVVVADKHVVDHSLEDNTHCDESDGQNHTHQSDYSHHEHLDQDTQKSLVVHLVSFHSTVPASPSQ